MEFGTAGGSPDDVGVGDSDPVTRVQRLDLDRQVGPSVWLAVADGDPVSARVVAAGFISEERRDQVPHRVGRLAALRSPQLVPLLGVADHNGSTWLVSEYVDGVSLARLLLAVTLTPGQAGHLAIRLLRTVALLHASGTPHGRLTADNVLVGVDGELRLTDWALASLAGARGDEETMAEDVTGARALVAELGRNADRPVVRHRGSPLLAELEQIGLAAGELHRTRMTRAEGPPDTAADLAADAERLEQALVAEAGETTGAAGTRAELGELVARLVRRHTSDESTPAARRRPMPQPVPQLLPSGRLSDAYWNRARRRRRLRRSILGAAAVATVAALLTAGYEYGGAPAGSLVDRFQDRAEGPAEPPASAAAEETDPATPGTTPEPPPEAGPPKPRPMPELAPPRAGVISGVGLRPLGPCSRGNPCLLRATANLSPSADVVEVGLRISVVNRCTGAVRTVPAGTVFAQTGWSYVYVTASVDLPRGRPLGVVAVTTTPESAASAPLLLPPRGGSC